MRAILDREEIEAALNIPIQFYDGEQVIQFTISQKHLGNVIQAAVDKTLWNIVEYLKGESEPGNEGYLIAERLEKELLIQEAEENANIQEQFVKDLLAGAEEIVEEEDGNLPEE